MLADRHIDRNQGSTHRRGHRNISGAHHFSARRYRGRDRSRAHRGGLRGALHYCRGVKALPPPGAGRCDDCNEEKVDEEYANFALSHTDENSANFCEIPVMALPIPVGFAGFSQKLPEKSLLLLMHLGVDRCGDCFELSKFLGSKSARLLGQLELSQGRRMRLRDLLRDRL